MMTKPAHRFVSECMLCAFEDQGVLRATPLFFNQPLPQPRIAKPATRPATLAETMVARFAKLGVTIAVVNFFGQPLDVAATDRPTTPPPPQPQRTFVMPKPLPQAA